MRLLAVPRHQQRSLSRGRKPLEFAGETPDLLCDLPVGILFA